MIKKIHICIKKKPSKLIDLSAKDLHAHFLPQILETGSFTCQDLDETSNEIYLLLFQ